MTTSRLDAIVVMLMGKIPVGRAMTWAMIDQILVKGAMFAFGLLAARAIGLEGFGRFTIVLVVLYFLQELHGMFLTAPMMTLAGTRSRSAHYFACVSRLNLVVSATTGVAVACAVFALFALRDGEPPFALATAAGASAATSSYQVGLRRILFARQREAAAFVLDLGYFGLLLGSAGIGHWLFGWTAEGLLWLIAAASLATILPFSRSDGAARISWRLARAVVTRHWTMSRWLLSTTLVTIGQEQAVWLTMSFVLGDAAVGSVRVGQYLYGLVAIPLTAMHNYVVRQAAEAYATGRERGLLSYLWRETLTLGAIIAALVALVVVPGALWLDILFHVNDATAVFVLQAFAGIYPTIFLRDLWIFYLRTVNRTHEVFLAMATSSLLAAALAYPFTAWFGATGALGVIAIANLVSMSLVLRAVHAHQREATRAGISPPLLSTQQLVR